MSSNDEIKNQGQDPNDNDIHHDHSRFCGHHRMWKFPFIVALVVLIKSGLVLVLWNALIPEVFHGPELNYLQALELTVLVKVLVGMGGGFRHRFGHHHHGGHHFRHWMRMSPEERLKLREEMRVRCRR